MDYFGVQSGLLNFLLTYQHISRNNRDYDRSSMLEDVQSRVEACTDKRNKFDELNKRNSCLLESLLEKNAG